jgi:hypothetical protein
MHGDIIVKLTTKILKQIIKEEYSAIQELEEGYGRPAFIALTGTYKTEQEAEKALAQARIKDPQFFENKPEGAFYVQAETIYKIKKAEEDNNVNPDDFRPSTIK